MTPYEVLGTASEATSEEIRRAYVGLARRHHPDFFAQATSAQRADAERRMQAVNEAWAQVGTEERRRAYDQRNRTTGESAPPRPFQAYDDSDDPDPLSVPDVPYRRDAPQALARRRSVTLVPIGLFAFAVLVFCVALVVGSFPMVLVSVVVLAASGVGFVVIPLVMMSSASRDEG